MSDGDKGNGNAYTLEQIADDRSALNDDMSDMKWLSSGRRGDCGWAAQPACSSKEPVLQGEGERESVLLSELSEDSDAAATNTSAGARCTGSTTSSVEVELLGDEKARQAVCRLSGRGSEGTLLGASGQQVSPPLCTFSGAEHGCQVG
jgi:hypothetical protein